jgi:renalase
MRVIVVGAGVSGLVAARDLQLAGHEVTVFDKGRAPGGRLATRRIGEARVDHGAQFFTVRSEQFQLQVEGWMQRDIAQVWSHGFGAADGHPRYAGTSGMTSLAKDLATGLDLRCDHLVFTIRPGTLSAWEVVIDDGSSHLADAVVVTSPLPQAFSLLVDSGLDIPHELITTDYDRTLALLAVLDGPSAVPDPGAVDPNLLLGTEFSFIGDNLAKGISAISAVTFHATAEWSLAHWDDEPSAALALLCQAARPWLGASAIVEQQLKRWRFATPRRLWPEPCWVAPGGAMVLAGDAFAGPKASNSNIEGAFVSGVAAAAALSSAASL